MSIAVSVIEARAIPVTLGQLQYLFANVEESHPTEATPGYEASRFHKVAADFYASGYTSSDASIELLMNSWLMEQSLRMQYSPGDAAVLSGDAKAYDYVPGGREFKDDIEEFKTSYMHAPLEMRAEFLQWHADAIQAMVAQLEGEAA